MEYIISAAIAVIAFVFVPMAFRRIVSTNSVVVVQSGKKTTSYGANLPAGNVYYSWPAWMPFIGVITTELPVSNFQRTIKGYAGYDKDRVPFLVDIAAFFRISDTDTAAKRVGSTDGLTSQLDSILQGAVRKILASYTIHEIMESRGKLGDEFTAEVDSQLAQWGVSTTKNIEFMDIQDHPDSNVIENIMAVKQSEIARDSRVQVAENNRTAKIAEIDAAKEVEMKNQDSQKFIGERTAEKTLAVNVANEKSKQETAVQLAVTAEKEMAVVKITQTQTAEINKTTAKIRADQDKEVQVINAAALLEKQTKEADGIKVLGAAKADAEKALQMAPITAQIELAKEIGENQGYQSYLISVKRIEAEQAIGIKQAEALASADLKVIANGGDVQSGMSSIIDIISPKGGTALGGMLEALGNTDAGKTIIDNLKK